MYSERKDWKRSEARGGRDGRERKEGQTGLIRQKFEHFYRIIDIFIPKKIKLQSYIFS